MTAIHEQLGGGDRLAGAIVPNPLEEAEAAFSTMMYETAAERTLGPPGLVRIGALSSRIPVMLPAEGSVLFGDPKLLIPEVVEKPKRMMDPTEYERAKRAAEEAAATAKRLRLDALAVEGNVAAGVMNNVMVQGLTHTWPGWLHLTTYHPANPTAFSGFGVLATKGLYEAHAGSLAGLLHDVAADVKARHPGLHGYPSLNAYAELGGVRPSMPWRIVSIIANHRNELDGQLSAKACHALDYIREWGPRAGVYVLQHGLPASETSHDAQYHMWLEGTRASTDAIGVLNFALDRPASASAVAGVAEKVVAKYRSPQTVARLALAEHIPRTPAARAEYERGRPGARYRGAIARGTHNIKRARDVVAQHNAAHPLLTRESLTSDVPRATVRYHALAAGLPSGGGVMDRVKETLRSIPSNMSVAELAAVCAAVGLFQGSPDHRQQRIALAMISGQAFGRIDAYRASFGDLVAITGQHGQDRLGAMQVSLEGLLPNDPPAWAFELADRRSTVTDLERRFGEPLMKNGRIIDQGLFNRLYEYRRLELNNFAGTPPNVRLRMLLARRAERSGLSLDGTDLPASAVEIHNAWATLIDRIGHRPTPGERARSVATTALGALTSRIARHRPEDGDSEEPKA
ncbi:MAG TPA: hypothetical protein VLH84_04890 [Patescibacteria group bacterium]|nr:hypothetical protein [Patescibacteria group bacterium]